MRKGVVAKPEIASSSITFSKWWTPRNDARFSPNVIARSATRGVAVSGQRAIVWQRARKVAAAVVLTAMLIGGCAKERGTQAGTVELAPQVDLGPTIGSLAEAVMPKPTAVEGYGIVGGLPGTGSAECPPQIRAYLKRYIPTQLPDSDLDVDKLIDSPDTSVVRLDAVIPAAASKGQRFDVRVAALAGTQTTSLEGGWLYTAELAPAGAFVAGAQPVATVEGAVFIDTLDSRQLNKRVGYVLGGGKVAGEYAATLVLRTPDYRAASAIRNKINERFGPDVARAISSGQIEMRIPQRYSQQRIRFLEVVKATYIEDGPEITEQRVSAFVRKLAVSADKDSAEIALEAIGKAGLSKLGVLLNSSDQDVRLRAARCMLILGSDRGFDALGAMVVDPNCAYRVEALEAIAGSANPADAATLARTVLQDRYPNVMLAAYEQLRKLGDPTISRESVGRSFSIEQAPQTPRKAIFVSRKGPPRIVLFGGPLVRQGDIFIQSQDGSVVIDSRAGQDYVSVARKHPTRPAVMGPLRSSRDLGDIIKALCEEPVVADTRIRGGLGVSYADMIALVKQMCDKDAVEAEFWAGPLPEIGLTVKK